LEKGSVGIQVREVRKVDKGRRKISALLSFVSFSKLVILVYTGQPVENNTAYARYKGKHSTVRLHGILVNAWIAIQGRRM
jgi:hypothetical protein